MGRTELDAKYITDRAANEVGVRQRVRSCLGCQAGEGVILAGGSDQGVRLIEGTWGAHYVVLPTSGTAPSGADELRACLGLQSLLSPEARLLDSPTVKPRGPTLELVEGPVQSSFSVSPA